MRKSRNLIMTLMLVMGLVLSCPGFGATEAYAAGHFAQSGIKTTASASLNAFPAAHASLLRAVKISSNTATLYVKQTKTLSVKNAKGQKVTWSSSNRKVATVTTKGKVAAVKKGTATITARVGSKKYTCKVTVKNPTLSKSALTVYAGKTSALKVSHAVGKVYWSSSNKKVATVTSAGVVKGTGKGTATITAKASGVNLTCKVTVKKYVSGIKLSQTSGTLKIGETMTVKPTVTPSDATYTTWTVTNSDSGVISYNTKTGTVTALKDGTAKLTFTTKGTNASGKKVSAACTITVKTPLESAALTGGGALADDGKQENVTLTKDSMLQLDYTYSPAKATGVTCTYTSADPRVATVLGDGLVTAVASGSTEITAVITDQYGTEITLVQPITVHTYIDSVNPTADKTEIRIGETTQVTCTVLPEDATDRSYTVENSDESVVSFDQETGKVTGLKDGTATLTFTAKDTNVDGETVSGKVRFTVKTCLENAVLNTPDAVSVDKDKTVQLEYTLTPAQVPVTVTYASANTDVATVSDTGLVTGKKSGTTTITITINDKYGNSKELTQTVNVITHVESLQLSAPSATLYTNNTYHLGWTILPADANNQKVTLSSSNEAVAAIDESGNVKAVSVGNAVITVTSVDTPEVKATFDVTVEEVTNNMTVATQEELNEALKNENLEVLTIETTEEVTLNIGSADSDNTMDLSSVSLFINAPKAHIENYVKFKDVTIQAISNTTYVEHTDNTVNYEAESGTLEVADGAVVTINVMEEDSNLNLVNNGNVTALNISAASADVTISGESSQLAMPVSVSSGAESAEITTSKDLNINAEETFTLNIEAGAENTTATVDDEESLPEINGLGRVPVTVLANGSVEAIVADSTGIETTQTAVISGLVNTSDDESAEGAEIYVLPYDTTVSADNADVTKAVATAVADSDGAYKTEAISIGNYYLLIKKDGYIPVLQTLIITSTSDSTYTVSKVTLVSQAAEEQCGTLNGTLVNAQTGEAVEEGLSIYLRAGSNNISGEYLDKTTTDENGQFTFANVLYGQYTVQVVDQRENQDGYYVSSSFDAYVTSESNTISNSITKVLNSDQVRFVLTWGDEESGASSDLDSHLFGPGYNGETFHTAYYSKEYTYYDDDDNEILCADLDVDDTSWEGPETTTIYQNTKGVYHFYVNDYVNDSTSTVMGRSNAVVNVYIGSKLMATYNCPNMTGNYWYVCDYDSTTNKFITRGDVFGFDGSSRDIADGDFLSYCQNKLTKTIAEADTVLANLSEDTGATLQEARTKAKNVLDSSEKISELYEAYQELNSMLEDYTEGLYIDDFSYENSDGISLINDWDTYDDDDYWILDVSAAENPDYAKLEVSASEGSTCTLLDSDKEDYDKAVKVTNQYGISRVYYIDWGISIDLCISSIYAYADSDEENNLIRDWDIYTGDNGEDVLTITGTVAEMPDNLTVIASKSYTTVNITDSDLAGYSKMVTISCGDNQANYYIIYEKYFNRYIDSVQALDEDNNLIKEWGTNSVYDDDDEFLYRTLVLKGSTAQLPETLTVTPEDTTNTVEIKDSDRSEFDKMVVISNGTDSCTYYISYEKYFNRYIDSVQALDEDNNLIKEWNTVFVYDNDHELLYRTLVLTGSTAQLPENLTVTPEDTNNTAEIKDSDRSDFDKMVVISDGTDSCTYYISYKKYFNRYIDSVQALDDEDNNLIKDWDTDSVYDDDDDLLYRTLVLTGSTAQLPENLTVTPEDTNNTAEIKDSDRSDFDKMVVISDGSNSCTYYISYEKYFNRYIDSITALDDEDNDLIIQWDTDYDCDDVNLYYYVMIIGSTAEIPDTLTVTPKDANNTVEITDSDISDTDKMIVISDGTKSCKYYIYYSYDPDTEESEDIATAEEGEDGEDIG